MAVTSSEPISITDLANEFGGDLPHSLTEYYRNGGLVPTNSTNGSVPTVGNPISLTNFFGTTASGGGDTSDTLTLSVGVNLVFRGKSNFAGQLDPTTVEFDSWNVTINLLYYRTDEDNLYLIINSNSGNGEGTWTSMQLGSTTFNRADATYSVVGGKSQWVWSGGGSAMPSSGDVSVVFTQ